MGVWAVRTGHTQHCFLQVSKYLQWMTLGVLKDAWDYRSCLKLRACAGPEEPKHPGRQQLARQGRGALPHRSRSPPTCSLLGL